MNLSEIIQDTLAILRLGTEASATETYRREFTRYANDAITIISQKFKQTRIETVPVDDDSCFVLADLDRPCTKIEKVVSHGVSLPWEQTTTGSGEIRCLLPSGEKVGVVKVYYQYRPARLVNLDDVPELPEHLHDMIADYVAAQHRYSQDGTVSAAGNYQMQTFERKLAGLSREYLGEPSSYVLQGYNERLL